MWYKSNNSQLVTVGWEKCNIKNVGWDRKIFQHCAYYVFHSFHTLYVEVMLEIIWILTCKFTQYFLLIYFYFTVLWTVEFLLKKHITCRSSLSSLFQLRSFLVVLSLFFNILDSSSIFFPPPKLATEFLFLLLFHQERTYVSRHIYL